jgi:hypothetical protein
LAEQGKAETGEELLSPHAAEDDPAAAAQTPSKVQA